MSIFSVGGSTPSDSAAESKSLRFDSATEGYLSRTFATAGNRKTWTFSCWAKRSGQGVAQTLFSANASNKLLLQFTATDDLLFNDDEASSNTLI